MLDGVTGFVKRHRRKLLVATGIAASGYFLVDYIKTKFFELQDRLATERAAKENLKRRFEQNQQDATYTIMALLPSLTGNVVDKFQVENVTAELQAKRGEASGRSSATTTTNQDVVSESGQTVPSVSSVNSESTDLAAPEKPRKTKTQLWKELKIQSLTRAFTLIYSSALLVFFTRLQLNILGRKNYVLSVMQLAEKQHSDQVSLEDREGGLGSVNGESLENIAVEEEELRINRTYLTFSWWLLHKGWVSLSERIEDAVKAHFDVINPRTDLTLQELSQLIGKVQYAVDDPENEKSNFLNNLLPPTELESYVLAQAPTGESTADEPAVDAALRKLLDETADFIESPNANEVVCKLVHSGLSVFVGKIGSLYPSLDETSTNKVKLASILANITKQTPGMTGGTPFEPNEYANAMINVPELDGFSALVYSNFDWTNIAE